MSEQASVSVRDLRNHASEVLRRVEAGERLQVTVDRRPVAEIIPLPKRREAVSFAEHLAWWESGGGADPGLLNELAASLTETTDDVHA